MRDDDPNDLIPHEHRRDLRGLRLISAWLNDNDIREGNTLDMYVEEDGRRFLKHYLIDAGSALGSDTTHPNIDRMSTRSPCWRARRPRPSRWRSTIWPSAADRA
jgi:hypothetical protein